MTSESEPLATELYQEPKGEAFEVSDIPVHPVAELFPRLSAPELAVLAEDIRNNGLQESIVMFQGELIDGRNRLAACRLAEVEPTFREYVGGDAVRFILSANIMRRHLDTSQRAMVASRLANMRQGERTDIRPSADLRKVSQTEAAALLNVSERSVTDARAIDRESPSLAAKVLAGEMTINAAKAILDGPSENVPHVAHNSGNNEWYTPDEILDAARDVLGGFDLDPATSVVAQHRVQAATFYTAEDNGLEQSWSGRVWMNPPYSADRIGKFIGKLCDHFEAGEVSAAIVLVNNATETTWFQQAAVASSAICFPSGRVKFLRENGESGAPLQGQALLYFGPEDESFLDRFAGFGFCCSTQRQSGRRSISGDSRSGDAATWCDHSIIGTRRNLVHP